LWLQIGNDDCWFKHNEKEISDIRKIDIQNFDMIQRLFAMMEKFSERMAFFESQI
jgi:hypothetical protein